MEEEVLWKNPHLKAIFNNIEHLYEKPLVINEISFATKEPVIGHILMAGDSAGMIAPLCGIGMAMDIHAGKILTEEIQRYYTGQKNRSWMEARYAERWSRKFSSRLQRGRLIQKMFGNRQTSAIAVAAGRILPFYTKGMIALTHGKPF
jgi:flavin-dependent dehydrogenase